MGLRRSLLIKLALLELVSLQEFSFLLCGEFWLLRSACFAKPKFSLFGCENLRFYPKPDLFDTDYGVLFEFSSAIWMNRFLISGARAWQRIDFLACLSLFLDWRIAAVSFSFCNSILSSFYFISYPSIWHSYSVMSSPASSSLVWSSPFVTCSSPSSRWSAL